MILAALLLFSGLAISAVAIYYSVVGLTAIFAAAAIPIMIMGVSLEVGKLVIASWVKAYWTRIPFLMRTYAVLGVAVLMIITSLGIFGFLSKAHSDQTLVSGDVQSKIAVYDEKIKTEKENIEANRKALKQMDEGVDQVLGRSTDEKGADKAMALRRTQQKERSRLQAEILQSQKSIAELNDARAPIAAEIRKVEAEVGPIKYIAAFVYGDNPDAGILERAVTWVIILIVIVFDPLAVVMLLAAQMTWQWYKNPEQEQDKYENLVVDSGKTIDEMIEQDEEQRNEIIEQTTDAEPESAPPAYLNQPFAHFGNLEPMPAPKQEPEPKLETTPFDPIPGADARTLITDNSAEVEHLQAELNEAQSNVYELANYVQNLQQDYSAVTDLHQKSITREAELIEELDHLRAELEDRNAMNIVAEPDGVDVRPFTEQESAALDAYNDERLVSIFDKLQLQPGVAEPIANHPELQAALKDALEEGTLEIRGSYEPAIEPEVGTQHNEPEIREEEASVALVAPDTQPEILTMGIDPVERPGDYITDPVTNLFSKRQPNTGYGVTFPDDPTRGDLYLRTDFRPSRLFKWNDKKWIEVNKNSTDAYTYNDAYIQYLAEKLMTGELTLDDLTDTEQSQVQTLIGGRRG